MDRETIILAAYAFLLYAIGYECYHCNKNLEKLVAVAEQADALRLERSTHSECIGSSPVSDTLERRNVMEKVWKHYEDNTGNTGKCILAYYGLSRPMNQNNPFIEGYWISLDLNGSEQFIPKLEFERDYREVKKPEVTP